FVEKAKANDPASLKAEIGRLRAELAKPAAAVDEAATLQARREGFTAGVDATWAFFQQNIRTMGAGLRVQASGMIDSLDRLAAITNAEKPEIPAGGHPAHPE